MSLVAKRFRHFAVVIQEVRVSDGIIPAAGQQRPQSQRPDVAHHQTLIGWRDRQPVNRGPGFSHVIDGPAIKQ